jgi:hypothetical protein
MLWSTKELRGYTIRTTDDAVGNVDGFFFDDRTWAVRYLVADVGRSLPGRRVLIPRGVLGEPDREAQNLTVALTMEQVENSPPISADEPVSRQIEGDLHENCRWSPYWRAGAQGLGLGAAAVARTIAEVTGERDEEEADPCLRSSREIIGYAVQAEDGEIGRVEDSVCDDDTWVVRYLLINPKSWLPGKMALFSTNWIKRISWPDKAVYVHLLRDTVKGAPEFSPTPSLSPEYEAPFFDNYGRSKGWIDCR